MNTPHRSCTLAFALLFGLAAGSASAQIENGSFETGDFTGWTAEDLADPLLDLQVAELGAVGYFGLTNEPTNGDFSAVNGFDGAGPGTISLSQDVFVPASTPTLLVDFMAQWDLLTVVNTSTTDRTFRVAVQEVGGGAGLADIEVFRAPAQTVNLDGDRFTAAVNLSAFKGQTVQLDLAWDVPEEYTGPAFFDLDNVRLAGKKPTALQKASLKVGLNFAESDHDMLKLDLVVPVPPDFDPEGQAVTVTVGDVVKDFTLDAAGKAQVDGDQVKLLPVGGEDGYRRLRLTCAQGDFASDFDAYGLSDETTPSGGITAAVPVTVDLAGATTSREFVAIYKGLEEATGKAKARPVSDAWKSTLTVDLDLSQADHDSIELKTAVIVGAGFDPEGTPVSIDVGQVNKDFEPDMDGFSANGSDTLVLARDPHNPARQTVTLTCKAGNFLDLHEDFPVGEDTPPGGLKLIVPVSVTIDGVVTRTLVPVTYKAKAGASGKAKS